MFHKEISLDFLSAASSHVSPQRCSFTVKVGCQGAHLRLLYASQSLQDRKSILWIHHIFPQHYMFYPSRHLLSLRCSMGKFIMQSAMWDREAEQDMSVALYVNTNPSYPVFPCRSIIDIVPDNMFYSLSEDTFTHSSVITAFSQAIMCITCVCVCFQPIF